jgi:hypothetical protein
VVNKSKEQEMIQLKIRNAMDKARLTIFKKNYETYTNQVSDPDLQQLVDDWRAGLCELSFVETMTVGAVYKSQEDEIVRMLAL